MPFSLRHIPALLVATTTTFGGIWPIFNAKSAMLEYGFPPRIAESPEAKPVMIEGGARTTALGMLVILFYYQQKYTEVDAILAIFGAWAGIIDTYLVWKEGTPRMAIFRLIASWAIAGWGLAGMTAGR